MATSKVSGPSGSACLISGVPISFPFEPYACQVVYMERVIQALRQRTNAILESPTGTGKTLCLLCATLAWRQEELRRKKLVAEEGKFASQDALWDSRGSQASAEVPKIIYASRTHSQLSQVIQELKNTQYRPKVAVIGSREQLCIHSEVMSKESNAEKVHLCRAKVHSRSCGYYNNLDMKRVSIGSDHIMDIEDLVVTGNQQRMCPYYMAKELKSEAELIFMPYNYILDVKTRQMHGIDVQGTVVILDEAHNIERVCEDSASFDITSSDIAHCISDVGVLLKNKVDAAKLSDGVDRSTQEDIEQFMELKEILIKVEESLDAVQFAEGRNECTQPGSFILDFFASAGITLATYGSILDKCGNAISLLTSGSDLVHRSGGYIQKFVDALKIVFQTSSSGVSLEYVAAFHYRVFVKSDIEKKSSSRSTTWAAPTEAATKRESTHSRTLSYWCFSPGHTMCALQDQGVHSIILTSGTLSPLDSFSSELQLKFPVSLQGSHVIDADQVWLGVVSRGCDNVKLNSSFANRFSSEYQSSLGNTLVNFARTIPRGMLVFFPSYPVMSSCWESWRESGILSRIEQHKAVIKEPKRKKEFLFAMDAFYEKVHDPICRGAAFFAVCRGKVSEGLDFADANGRAVVITGIPYPPKVDPKVQLKMEYLNQAKQRDPKSSVLNDRVWYKQQASRAVNQAIGRVIRHRNDYGAIILCDERFSWSDTQEQLPIWLKPSLKEFARFGGVQRDLIQFFKNAEAKYGDPQPRKTVSTKSEVSSQQMASAPPLKRRKFVESKLARCGEFVKAEEREMATVAQSVPEVLLAKLKEDNAMEKRKGLLDSLQESESRGGQDQVRGSPPPAPIRSVFSHSKQSSSHCAIPTSEATAVPLTKKPKARIRIVGAEYDSCKVNKAQDFLSQLKQVLSKDSLRKFTSLIATYKQNEEFHTFSEGLEQIFYSPTTRQVIPAMGKFIHKQHSQAFAQWCEKMTGTRPLS